MCAITEFQQQERLLQLLGHITALQAQKRLGLQSPSSLVGKTVARGFTHESRFTPEKL